MAIGKGESRQAQPGTDIALVKDLLHRLEFVRSELQASCKGWDDQWCPTSCKWWRICGY